MASLVDVATGHTHDKLVGHGNGNSEAALLQTDKSVFMVGVYWHRLVPVLTRRSPFPACRVVKLHQLHQVP